MVCSPNPLDPRHELAPQNVGGARGRPPGPPARHPLWSPRPRVPLRLRPGAARLHRGRDPGGAGALPGGRRGHQARRHLPGARGRLRPVRGSPVVHPRGGAGHGAPHRVVAGPAGAGGRAGVGRVGPVDDRFLLHLLRLLALGATGGVAGGVAIGCRGDRDTRSAPRAPGAGVRCAVWRCVHVEIHRRGPGAGGVSALLALGRLERPGGSRL